mgnify:CR=1 FL=1
MMIIYYRNKEIENLFMHGKSIAYKAIMSKRMFMKVVCAFKAILRTIDNVVELENYHWLRYETHTKFSSVQFEGAGVLGELYFTEKDNGTRIIINDLIINNYGKERNI